MLYLKRYKHQRILIGDGIAVVVSDLGHGWARIGVEAPADVAVDREEVRAGARDLTKAEARILADRILGTSLSLPSALGMVRLVAQADAAAAALARLGVERCTGCGTWRKAAGPPCPCRTMAGMAPRWIDRLLIVGEELRDAEGRAETEAEWTSLDVARNALLRAVDELRKQLRRGDAA